MTLAERLAHHPNVALTRYPGLASHPTHEAARRQLKGFGTIISFDVRGDAPAADAVCVGLQLIQHATSLGAVDSTIERRASIPGQEHLPPAPAQRGHRRRRGPLDRSGSSAAQRSGSVALDAHRGIRRPRAAHTQLMRSHSAIIGGLMTPLGE
jgi:hypothetical protein